MTFRGNTLIDFVNSKFLGFLGFLGGVNKKLLYGVNEEV
jgi:hypothetical protein